jgi:ribosomal protein S18 acetylase RimI-like enzyme
VEIRQAVIEDLITLQQLGRETYRHYFGDLWHNSDELEAFLAHDFGDEEMQSSLQDVSYRWIIALEHGNAIGFAKLHFDQPLGIAKGQGAKLCKLYFTPQSRSRGVGSRVFAAVESAARERQQPVLWLDVLQSNLPAIGFYQRQGMHQVIESAYVTETQTTKLWIMKKDIDD